MLIIWHLAMIDDGVDFNECVIRLMSAQEHCKRRFNEMLAIENNALEGVMCGPVLSGECSSTVESTYATDN